MLERICKSCGESKSLDEFYNSPTGLHGKAARCKSCLSAAAKVKHRETYQSKLKKILEREIKTGNRICKGCKQTKSLSNYRKNKNGLGGLDSRCRKCVSGYYVSKLFKGASVEEQNKIRERLWRAEKKEQGLCTRCGINPLIDQTSCELCRDKRKFARLSKITQWTRQGKCKRCGSEKKQEDAYCIACKEKLKIIDSKKKKAKRLEALNFLGGVCACCGESIITFLTFDHINNDGSMDRRSGTLTSTTSFYNKIIQRKRLDIQILCFSCNLGKHLNGGICPHKSSPTLLTD